MVNQIKTIEEFCNGAAYYWVRFESNKNEDFGKIMQNGDLKDVDLTKHEIHRSIDFINDNKLFVYSLLPEENTNFHDNQLKVLIKNLEEARAIELIYPNIFRWVYDGLCIKAYAIVPSGDIKQHSTITRYGGTTMFMKILRQHLNNIGKMNRGITPDYNFLKDDSKIEETELAVGSINQKTGLYSVGINLSMDFIHIINNSTNNVQTWNPTNVLHMKYWSKEINPDFVVEAKHIKLNQYLTLDEGPDLYPQPIKALMALKHKGNFYRFLLSRFLLSVHRPHDAKFMYYSVLSDEEREHVKSGNCSTQWNYVMNNMKRYDCPSMMELKHFCDENCKLSHPLEDIQKYLEEKEKKEKENE